MTLSAKLAHQKNSKVESRSPYNLLTWDQKVGLHIQILRKQKGWEQSELAERLFVSDSTVGRWERGVIAPKGEMLNKIAIELGVDAKDLLP